MHELANAVVDELARQAWDREFTTIQPRTIINRHSMVVQTILSDGSIPGNLACTIPEAITTLRGKAILQERLNMETEQMILINEEIMVSNARKFGESSILRAHFSKQYTQLWYTKCCDNGEVKTT